MVSGLTTEQRNALVAMVAFLAGATLATVVAGWWWPANMPLGRWRWGVLAPWASGVLAVLSWGLAAGLVGRVWLARRAERRARERVADAPTWLILPRSDWRPIQVGDVHIWARLADALPHDEHVSFEVAGNAEGVAFSLRASEAGFRAVWTQIKQEWPGVQRRPALAEVDPAHVPDGWHVFWCELVPASTHAPITPRGDDPLMAALVELNAVVGHGRGLVQVIARNDFGTRARLGRAAFAARAAKVENVAVRQLRTREAKTLEDRAEAAFLQTTVRCVGLADTPARAEGVARGLARALCAQFTHSNPVRVVATGRRAMPVQERAIGHNRAWADNELDALMHLVGKNAQAVAPRLLAANARALPPDPSLRVTPKDKTARMEVA